MYNNILAEKRPYKKGELMIKARSNNKKNIDIQQIISSNESKEIEITLTYPTNLDFTKEMSTTEYFDRHVEKTKSLYKSKNPSLTLLYAKYLEKKEGDFKKDQLETSLRLFSYQFIQKLKDYSSELGKDFDADRLSNILSEIQKTLNAFRNFQLSNQEAIRLFLKIDHLLSYEVEQFLLKSISILKKKKDSDELISGILMFAESERAYRKDKKYVKDDSTEDFKRIKDSNQAKITVQNDRLLRLSNKMDMNKRLIELPLKISEKVFKVGKKEKYIALAVSTGFIMLLFSLTLFQARVHGIEMTIQFVVGLAVIYVVRDLFREEFKNYLYDKITSVRPILKSFMHLPGKYDSIGMSLTWFSKKHESVVNSSTYKDRSKLIIKEKQKLRDFDHYGFKRVKTTTTFNLAPIMDQITRNDKELYIFDDETIIEEVHLPRQYKLSLKVAEITYKRSKLFTERIEPKKKEKEFIIIINRNEVVSIKEKKK